MLYRSLYFQVFRIRAFVSHLSKLHQLVIECFYFTIFSDCVISDQCIDGFVASALSIPPRKISSKAYAASNVCQLVSASNAAALSLPDGFCNRPLFYQVPPVYYFCQSVYVQIFLSVLFVLPVINFDCSSG